MSWLLATILAYLILTVVSLLDKYIVAGPLPNPKVYAFYVGICGIFIWLLAPFGFLKIPQISVIVLAVLAGIIRILAIFYYFTALRNFDVSRVAPILGSIIAIFTFLLSFFFSIGEKFLAPKELIALFLLLAGSLLISFEKEKSLTFQHLKISTLAAFLFSLSFLFSKFVYLNQPFWSGYIWISLGFVLTSLFFSASKEVKEEIFAKKELLKKKTLPLFLLNQVMGAGFFVLQNWSIALAPLAYLSIINALEGIQYVFLLIFASLISWKFPKIFKEEISRKTLFQKIIAILIIIVGLAILAIK